MSTNYNGRTFTVGDTIYFSKFGTTISASSYASGSGTFGTCSGKITNLYEATYNFPIVVGGKITAGTGGSFTGAAVKPADCSKGYQVTVTYNRNPNSGTSGSSSQFGYVGASLTGTASRSGYTFAGWYTSSSGGSKVTTIPTNGTTYYAHWTANKYTVTLNNQSATTAGSTSVTATFGSAMPSITKPTKTGYTFGGYYTSTGGSGTQYYTAAGGSARSYDYAGARTLYAKWTANSYTVHFDGNGATSGSMNDQSFTYASSQALTSNGFSRGAAFLFTGWNTDPEGTGTAIPADYSASTLSSINGDTVTLYAQWSLQYLSPTISNVNAQRYKNGSADDEGTCAHITFNWAVDLQVSSSNYATSVKIQYKPQSSTSWSNLQEWTYNSQTSSSKSGSVSFTSSSGLIDTDLSYDIRISITDYYGSHLDPPIPAPQAVANTFISLAFFTVDWSAGGKGMGIGVPAPTTGLKVAMNTEFTGDLAGVDADFSGEVDITQSLSVGALDDGYGINDTALLSSATITKWDAILNPS